MPSIFWFAFSFLLLFPISQSARAADAQAADDHGDKRARVALVIGFAAYPTAPLKNPVADAHQPRIWIVSQFLRLSKGGHSN